MMTLHTCPECGGKLLASAPEGLCPRCLIATALGETEEVPARPCPRPDNGPPRILGDYELLECIGGGGMGVVHKARHLRLGRIVAIKSLPFGPFSRESQVKRFQAEAIAAARLRHPHIVAIHEVGDHAGQRWFAMDYIDGPSLAELIREQPLSVTRAARFVRTLAEAVQYAHTQGILHRDLKPSNILVDALDQPHITDFGLAKDLRSGSELTLSGQTLGSPNYMPPEQWGGAERAARPAPSRDDLSSSGADEAAPIFRPARFGPSSDVYGLGAVFYHLLTGRPPFQGETVEDILSQLRERDPLAPRLLKPSVPADLETICLKCLEKEPARRYPTALELAEELRRWQAGEPIRARPVSRPERAWRWCRRRPALASALLAAAALFTVVSVGVPTAAFRVNRARQDAQAALQRHRVQLAEELFHRGDTRQALGNLVRVLREDPHNHLAANRLMSALTYRRFALPVTPPLTHAAAIKDAQFSPDGAVVVTASADGTAQLWNAQSGERLGQPMVHPMGEPTRSGNTVGSVAFSPDGRRVATGSANGDARVWDAATGAPLTDWLRPADPQATADPKSAPGAWRPGQVPTAHVAMERPNTVGGGVRILTEPRGVTRVRFTPDGARLVTASDDALVRIWDVANGTCVLTLPHDGLVWDAQFNFDGTLLVTSCWDFNAYVWDLRSERLLSRLAHRSRVLSAEFSPDGRRLLTSSRSEARLWRREGTDWNLHQTLRATGTGFSEARFTPDGRFIVTAASSYLEVFESPTGRLLRRQRAYAEITDIELSPDGLFVGIATGQEETGIHSVLTGPLGEPLGGAGVTSLRYSPDGRRVLTASSEGTALIWRVPRQPDSERFQHDDGAIRCAAFSPDRATFATGGEVRSAKIWSAETGRLRHSLLHEAKVFALAFSRDGQRIATASEDNTARLWRVSDGQPLSPPLRHGDPVKDVHFSPDGHWLLTASADYRARIWDTDSFQVVREFSHGSDVRIAAFAPDGGRIVTASDDFTARVWDARTGKPLTPPLRHGDEVLWAEFSPDGLRVASASRDGTTCIWDAHTGERLSPPLRHRAAVRTAHFDLTGERLVTASEDRTVRLWNTKTGQPITRPLLHDDLVADCAIGPGGDWIVSSSFDGFARFWDIATGQVLSEPLGDSDRGVWLPWDGHQALTASDSGRARFWETPGAVLPVPGWVLDITEALTGQRETAAGLEPIPPADLFRLRQQHSQRQGTDYYDRWARWFFTDPGERTLSPQSSRTIKAYLDLLYESGRFAELSEAAALAPDDARILARLAELELEQTPPRIAEAEFHSRRAAALAPDDPQVSATREHVIRQLRQKLSEQ